MSLIDILLRAKPLIRESGAINALWIEGSYATGKFNDESDIDAWLDIVPGEQVRALEDFKQAVSSITHLREVSEITYYSDIPRLAKVKLYIEGKPDDSRIELDMQERTREFVFDRKAHDIVVLFDKIGVITYGG